MESNVSNYNLEEGMINFPYNIPSSINGYILKIKKGNYFLKNINLKIIDEKFVKGTQNKLLLKQHLAGRYAVEKLIKNIKRTSSLLIKKDALNAPLLYVDSEQWGLSISHTQDIAIAVINFQNKLIGIDVEENTPLNVKFGKILPNDALINRSLIERWVVFESIGKACKIGLRINKKQIKWEGENIVVNIGKENIKLKLYLLHQHNHIFSLVWEE